MSTHKHIDKICAVAVVPAILLCLVFMSAEAFGIQSVDTLMGYEERLFDTGKVHAIDIVMEDWDSFIANAQSEEYSVCTVVIDGERFSNVGIRGKGNTSLSTVSSMDSQRYSFKIEFDQYDSTKSYHGLDKLSLNNTIQDATYMKDYLTYRMMGQFAVAAPLCSYVYITVNGEDWGLYLAVEGIEDSFLRRNYGADYGELYKPDSMSFGGGRGNGLDFNMEDFMESAGTESEGSFTMPEEGGMPEGFDPADMFGNSGGGLDAGNIPGSMGSSDVMLQYTDDDPYSYSNIFDNVKTDITGSDKERLIEALEILSSGENIESVVHIERVIRYFVVHNYVVNGDSYTGSMIHNYYLYEEDGVLSMLPWDYNLAFGTFMGGDSTGIVNDPIDTPLSVSGSGRPMIDWIFASEEYTALYHQYFAEFLESVDITAIIDEAEELIAPYVEKDLTAFYSYEEFEKGVATLRQFCVLRSESVSAQLEGSVPCTDAGQAADSSSLVDASHISLSDMGSMGGGFSGGIGGLGGFVSDFGGDETGEEIPDLSGMQPPDDMPQTGQTGMEPPVGESGTGRPMGGSSMPQMPAGMEEPENFGGQGTEALTGNFTRGDLAGTTGTQQNGGGSGIILLAVSAAVLLLGLIAAIKFKR